MKRAGDCKAGKLAFESDSLCLRRATADAKAVETASAIERLKLAGVIRGLDARIDNLADSASFELAKSHEGAAYQLAVLGGVIANMAAEVPAAKMDRCYRLLASLGTFIATEGNMKATPSMTHMLPAVTLPMVAGPVLEAKPIRTPSRNIKNSRVRVPVRQGGGERQAAKAS